MNSLFRSTKSASTVRRAFTLIELLVVISVIAILVALLLPVMGKARAVAIQVKCAGQERQLGITMHTYAGDNRGSMARFIENGTGADIDPYVYGTSDWYRMNEGYLLSQPMGPSLDAKRNIYQLGISVPIFRCPAYEGTATTNYCGPSDVLWLFGQKPLTFTYTFNSYRSAILGTNSTRFEDMPRGQVVLWEHTSLAFPQNYWYTANSSYPPMNDLMWNMFVSSGGPGAYSPGIPHNEGANLLFPGGEVLYKPASAFVLSYPSSWAILIDRF
jgi:prepilin-type N-terminal cleavage/methylation domain-containing protein